MAQVTIYTAVPCAYCSAAKRYFDGRGIPFDEIDLTGNRKERIALLERTGQRTVPQIFIGETHVGGYSDLMALEQEGKVDPLLESA